MLSVEVLSVSHGAQRAPSGVDGAVPSPGQPGKGEGSRACAQYSPTTACPVGWPVQAQGLILAEMNILTESLTDLTQLQPQSCLAGYQIAIYSTSVRTTYLQNELSTPCRHPCF